MSYPAKEARRKRQSPALLDIFYKRDGGFDREFLEFDPVNEAEVTALWAWFMEDRAKGEGSDAKA